MADRVDLSIDQARAMLVERKRLDNARVRHVSTLPEMLSAATMPDGRRLYDHLEANAPEALAVLKAVLVDWVDVGNSITALAQQQIDKIIAGEIPPPDGTIFH